MKEIKDKIQVLSKIGRQLNDAKISWAIGASLLLYLKGITDHFNDIDILVKEEDFLSTKEILLAMGEVKPENPNTQYKTRHFLEFTVEEVEVDLIAGFVILKDGLEYDCSLEEDQIVEHLLVNQVKIPLQSVSLWRKYYAWMQRYKKVAMIDKCNKK